ncbi:MAG: iron transporter [Sediminibacterium sp.]|nr:iron transporter [Sediminibacterium sp.]
MPVYKDQLNREITLQGTPRRIISLVPSQTELLFDLGLDEKVIGITKFCVHPEHWFRNKTRIGGTKTIKIDLIASLQPDLIIANKEENVQEQITALEKIAPVWVSDINNIEEAYRMIGSIGEITGTSLRADDLISQVKKELAVLNSPTQKKYRAAYLIWKDPYMSVGGDTFISDMLRISGFENVLADQTRYPSITTAELRSKNTELVFLSSEPYPFKQKHVDELLAELPNVTIMLVDGEMFSWYGSRMRYAAGYLKALREKLR